MASGKSLELRYMVFGSGTPAPPKADHAPRDRSLRGKARRLARKAARREAN